MQFGCDYAWDGQVANGETYGGVMSNVINRKRKSKVFRRTGAGPPLPPILNVSVNCKARGKIKTWNDWSKCNILMICVGSVPTFTEYFLQSSQYRDPSLCVPSLRNN